MMRRHVVEKSNSVFLKFKHTVLLPIRNVDCTTLDIHTRFNYYHIHILLDVDI